MRMGKFLGEYDLLIVGGGINGVGIARDAAGRGLRVLLCDRGDLGGETSMASSKLVHGGLRYLEQRQFRLVRESLAEREVLLRIAPHLVRPLRFVLPHAAGLRPAWMIRAGLWFYDRMGGGSTLPRSQAVDLRRPPYAGDLKATFAHGFAYSDCWVDDARLVVENAVSASRLGARILPCRECVGLIAEGGGWRAELRDGDGNRSALAAKAVVNAGGPWVGEFLRGIAGVRSQARVRLVKGSHIVVPRRIAGEHAYLLQNLDRRIVFVLPFERNFNLIGTTEETLQAPAPGLAISTEETGYLCDAANRYLAGQVHPRDVVWSFSGVRALFDDGRQSATEVTRDYVLQLDRAGNRAPILSVFGGKITTYRRLAEHALERLAGDLPMSARHWTAAAPLAGAATGHFDYIAFLKSMLVRYAGLPSGLVQAVVRRHGAAVVEILGDARELRDLGTHFGAGLTAREVDYFIASEWARTAEDVLWRRSKAGLHMTHAEREAVADYVVGRVAG
jgi:D-erythritol 1-phosphate dehydrogenase